MDRLRDVARRSFTDLPRLEEIGVHQAYCEVHAIFPSPTFLIDAPFPETLS